MIVIQTVKNGAEYASVLIFKIIPNIWIYSINLAIYIYVPFQLLVQNHTRKWNFPINFCNNIN